MTIKVILQKEASGNHYSLESGLADNIKNFDHHKTEHKHYPSPSNNPSIPAISEGIIEISHIDADTYIGLLRFYGKQLPNIDLNLVEKIDLNGSSICKDIYDKTLLYMVGIGSKARELNFPRCIDEAQDVTNFIEQMMQISEEEYINQGRKETDNIEKAYKDCHVETIKNIGLYSINANDAFDPSRPYKDGIEIVIVYREHYKSISIYCDPKSKYTFGGKAFSGIIFNGHPKACGSPRGVEYTLDDAKNVFNHICNFKGDNN